MLTLATRAVPEGFLLAFADGDAPSGSGSLISLLLPLVVIGGLFYFMMIMPQRKRAKALTAMRDAMSVGSEIRTVGGIYGVVTFIDGDDVTIDIGAGTTLRIVRRAIADVLDDPSDTGVSE